MIHKSETVDLALHTAGEQHPMANLIRVKLYPPNIVDCNASWSVMTPNRKDLYVDIDTTPMRVNSLHGKLILLEMEGTNMFVNLLGTVVSVSAYGKNKKAVCLLLNVENSNGFNGSSGHFSMEYQRLANAGPSLKLPQSIHSELFHLEFLDRFEASARIEDGNKTSGPITVGTESFAKMILLRTAARKLDAEQALLDKRRAELCNTVTELMDTERPQESDDIKLAPSIDKAQFEAERKASLQDPRSDT